MDSHQTHACFRLSIDMTPRFVSLRLIEANRIRQSLWASLCGTFASSKKYYGKKWKSNASNLKMINFWILYSPTNFSFSRLYLRSLLSCRISCIRNTDQEFPEILFYTDGKRGWENVLLFIYVCTVRRTGFLIRKLDVFTNVKLVLPQIRKKKKTNYRAPMTEKSLDFIFIEL